MSQLNEWETPDKPLIHPCECTGSCGMVHEDCLNHWRSTSSRVYERCEVCGYKYRTIKRTKTILTYIKDFATKTKGFVAAMFSLDYFRCFAITLCASVTTVIAAGLAFTCVQWICRYCFGLAYHSINNMYSGAIPTCSDYERFMNDPAIRYIGLLDATCAHDFMDFLSDLCIHPLYSYLYDVCLTGLVTIVTINSYQILCTANECLITYLYTGQFHWRNLFPTTLSATVLGVGYIVLWAIVFPVNNCLFDRCWLALEIVVSFCCLFDIFKMRMISRRNNNNNIIFCDEIILPVMNITENNTNSG